MQVLEQVSVDLVQKHLRDTDSKIFIGDYNMPTPPSAYVAFRVVLESDDQYRLFVWHEHRDNTHRRSYYVRDVNPAAASKKRIRTFIEGDDDEHFQPIDLRTAPGFEVVMVSNDAAAGPLSLIDGNHRALAQFITHRTVAGVPGYVAVHPDVIKWWNLPPHVRRITDRR